MFSPPVKLSGGATHAAGSFEKQYKNMSWKHMMMIYSPACYGKHDANTEVKHKRQASVSHTSALTLKLLKKYQPTPAVTCRLTNIINIFHRIVNNNNNYLKKKENFMFTHFRKCTLEHFFPPHKRWSQFDV